MNKIGFFVAALVFATSTVGTGYADDALVGTLKLTTPWARATPKGATVGGGYLTITNTGNAADRLVGGASDISSRFEIHEMSMEKGVMKMREVTSGVEIKPGQTVRFEPSGYHIMFVGLKQPLNQGDASIRKGRQRIGRFCRAEHRRAEWGIGVARRQANAAWSLTVATDSALKSIRLRSYQ